MTYHFISIWLGTFKIYDNIKCWTCISTEFFNLVIGSVSWYSLFGKQFNTLFLLSNHSHNLGLSNSFLRLFTGTKTRKLLKGQRPFGESKCRLEGGGFFSHPPFPSLWLEHCLLAIKNNKKGVKEYLLIFTI